MTIEQKLNQIKSISEQREKAESMRQLMELQPDTFSIAVGGQPVEILDKVTMDLIRATVHVHLIKISETLLGQATELMK